MVRAGMPSRAKRDADSGPHQPPSDARGAMYHFQANQGNQNTGPRRDTNRRPQRAFGYRYPPRASQRPLLTARHDSSEALTFPTNQSQDKFREVEDPSDAEEVEMDVSESMGQSYPSKRVRLEDNTSLSTELPRWSNPDPYTALPPVDDSNRKHKDVVKLIRKARVVETNSLPVMAAMNDQDFIAFDFDGDDVNTGLNLPPVGAPTGPKADFPSRTVKLEEQTGHDPIKLGKRKRDDNEDRPRPVTARMAQYNRDGMILPEWQSANNVNTKPWFQPVDGQGLEAPGISLHKEVLDFYEWVKPRDFEHAVRADLITRLQKALERLDPGGRLKPFGSFAAGLYLPTGDMDLVFLRRSFRGTRISPNGRLAKPRLDMVYDFAKFIRKQGLAQGVVKSIVNAKVPIIKFVDKMSGLKVDLSFDNDTGVTANETFQQWRLQYPAMPILVSVVKHFLMMRGLNDVAYGGLGGFSIICLVTSLIQHFPSTSQPSNLGLMLLEFFNLYGNLFNRRDIAIRLDPPSYISKTSQAYRVQSKEKPDCLSIIDPHRQDNNISAGTHDIQRIMNCFSKAHETLQHRLQHKLIYPGTSGSLLEDILGGNFSAYDLQRESLYNLHAEMLQKASGAPPPPPAPLPATVIPPPPPPSGATPPQLVNPSADATRTSVPGSVTASKHNVTSTGGMPTVIGASKDEVEEQIAVKSVRKAMNRALRFRELRPDISDISSLTQLTLNEAVKIGGYKNSGDMQMDLEKRAKAAGKNLGRIKHD